jgi:hypothetical protein
MHGSLLVFVASPSPPSDLNEIFTSNKIILSNMCDNLQHILSSQNVLLVIRISSFGTALYSIVGLSAYFSICTFIKIHCSHTYSMSMLVVENGSQWILMKFHCRPMILTSHVTSKKPIIATSSASAHNF